MKSNLLIGAAAAALAFSFATASAQHVPDKPSAPGGAIPATPHVAVQGPAAQVPPLNLPIPLVPTGNHYVCYPAAVSPPEKFKEFGVHLRDQFGQGTATVKGITRLCNPVEKTTEAKTPDGKPDRRVFKIVDEKLHIICYAITYGAPPRSPVMVNDQFGPKRIALQPATELCLPAGKKL